MWLDKNDNLVSEGRVLLKHDHPMVSVLKAGVDIAKYADLQFETVNISHEQFARENFNKIFLGKGGELRNLTPDEHVRMHGLYLDTSIHL